MFATRIQPAPRQNSDLSLLLDELSKVSTRPRYAFMLLTLIADVAHANGSAGPYVRSECALVPLRDWLSDALTPIGARDTKRKALAVRVKAELESEGRLPTDPGEALAMVEEEVRDRIRSSGKTNLSRAVTELVKAGLLRRHYQGFAVDHLNRGAQRHAVYTLMGRAKCLLGRQAPKSARAARQGELLL
ncbi:hypothetical protein KRR38_32515 [Novosphingobium sp. G106]|uniref:hypothetical protein n=1 Tax=Novosphingobium sp. G106 TaxID=2849500 RepID=UPI001C2D026C|nr:hypothetical protein [Novosphingobium sp. G106]MBV1692260.1 hypothetical protein [Novosphingobium sp. G106]